MHALKERGLGHVARLCSVEMSAPVHMSDNYCTLFLFTHFYTHFLHTINILFMFDKACFF